MEKPGLKFATKMANRKASNLRADGEIPRCIGLDGMLALMHDKILRYFKTRTVDEILGLAADGLFALEAALSDIEPPEEEIEEDINELLPPEFMTWQHDARVAGELRRYLEDTGQWDKIDDNLKDQIRQSEEAEDESESAEEE